ncbi:hypothetical protein [Agromyces sp. C10]|uniref:hypothetical protein n=1 Tax=Agromyces sp. C10 TaxID=2935077 RepID=UPI00200AFF47|nr:hypothetical protein [Agromyces sp. C10]MCK8610043.1 hypothetical protein [Agromyces sp. C10]
MRNRRITDDEAVALLRGQAPAARDDLAPLAEALGALRTASSDAPPRPTAALASRLDLDRASWISTPRTEDPTTAPTLSTRSTAPRSRRRNMAIEWFAGLGIAAKIAIGASAAAAVSVSGAGAAGAAGMLPAPAQHVFDQVTGGGAVDTVVEEGRETGDIARETAGDVRDRAETAREGALDDATGTVRDGIGEVGSAVDSVEEQATTGIDSARDAVEGTADEAEDAVDRAGSTVEDRVGSATDAAKDLTGR